MNLLSSAGFSSIFCCQRVTILIILEVAHKSVSCAFQATLHRNILHMAGQLGLDPPTMALVQGGATLEMQQAMKNCEAVAKAFNVSLRADAVAITIYCSAALSVKDLAQVEHCLHEFLHSEVEEDAAADASHSQRNMRRYLGQKIIPNSMILFVFVPALPKG